MSNTTTTNSSTRSDSTKSQNVLSERFPEGVFLTYAPEDCDYELRYYGGAYIECDYNAELRDGREFTCQDIIGVSHHGSGEVTIKTFADFAYECADYVQEREAMLSIFEDGEGDE